MKKFFTAGLFLLSIAFASAQLIVNSAVTTPSICYNDGTLTLNVSGGTAPYSYSIISGPVLPNVTYPILPDNGSSFASLHWGTYTVQITDNAGNTLLYNVTIPGNYEFPLLSGTIVNGTVLVTASLGLPPYQYAISTVGPNGPFGTYQSDNVFDSLCNDIYYVRVLDSCGNFYTTTVVLNQSPLSGYAGCFSQGGVDNITVFVTAGSGNPPFRYSLKNGAYTSVNTTGVFAVPAPYVCADSIQIIDFCNDTFSFNVDCHPIIPGYFCSNFSDSTGTYVAQGGTPPYTYRFYIKNAQTGNWDLVHTQDSAEFFNLPYTDMYTNEVRFDVIDACGRTTLAYEDRYLGINPSNNCPFDSVVTVTVPGALGLIHITCVNCNPPRTIVFTPPSPPGEAEFDDMDTGTYIFEVTDQCGETRTDTFEIPIPVPIQVEAGFTSCNDVVAIAKSSAGVLITSGVTFTLTDALGDTITQNTTGLFPDLPTGSYWVIGSYASCLDYQIGFSVPYFSGYCYTPFFDSLCTLRLIVDYGTSNSDLPETYSLIRSGVATPETPAGGSNGVSFNITPGAYQLVSDSGCAINQVFNFNYELSETHTNTCANTGDITLRPLNAGFFTCFSPLKYLYTLENSDTLLAIITDFDPVAFFPNLPADTFIARVYLNDSTVVFANAQISHSNQTCFLDSLVIIIAPNTVPFIISQNVTVCGAADVADIPFTVSGGFPPYFISIAGYPGITTNAQSGVLPNIPLGSYTMIVNDSCGISSSFSVSVVDSCVDCDTILSAYTVTDTSVCVGETITFQNLGSDFVTFVWRMNGTVFSTVENPTVTLTTAGDVLIECFMNLFLCRDTFSVIIHVSEAALFELGNDTLICDNFSRTLSSGIASTLWSTGVTASSIVVSSPGLYWGRVSGVCGTFADSIRIYQGFTPVVDLGNDSVLCSGDSIVLHASSGNDIYIWSNGSSAESIAVYQPGVYSVTVSSSGCAAEDDITLQSANIGNVVLPEDTLLCNGDVIVLVPAAGSNPVWQDGSQAPSYTVSDSGLYTVTVSSICGSVSDSVNITYELCVSRIHIPDAFTPNGDGNNDYFTVFGKSIAEYEIKIFNRWGEMVYSSGDASELNNLSRGWDGRHKGVVQTTATFAYYITAKGDDGQSFTEKGNLTLIR